MRRREAPGRRRERGRHRGERGRRDARDGAALAAGQRREPVAERRRELGIEAELRTVRGTRKARAPPRLARDGGVGTVGLEGGEPPGEDVEEPQRVPRVVEALAGQDHGRLVASHLAERFFARPQLAVERARVRGSGDHLNDALHLFFACKMGARGRFF